ncbi:MAG TPA: site-2 protease family protein [Anaerolineaceae bacterium]|nr:site-2 protease family protein [Anaerolineaceae bacterium]
MDATYNYELVESIVGRVMSVEDTTLGSDKQGYVVRYRGRIRMEDTAAAYDYLSEQLKSQNLTPLFRWDAGRHSVLLVQGLPKIKQSNPRINLLLGILTFASVLFTGALYAGQDLPSDPGQAILAVIGRGWPFAVSMLGILGAHEFGHYLMGRFHGVHVTLPYFIPMPLISPFGTMGAFINMKEPPKNRRVLLDIGIAGPLAGLAVAIPVLLIGLYISNLNTLNPGPNEAIQLEGNSIIYLFSKFLVFGKLLPAPVSYGGVSPILYWLRYFFTGQPLPFGGLDVNLSPVAWAGWGGLLVTAMNLVPAGQLDGGHMLYVLLGRDRAQKTFPFILAGLLLLSLAWNGWLIWALLIFLIGRVYAEPLDQVTPLDNKRKWLAVLALVLFILTFTPVPLGLLPGR